MADYQRVVEFLRDIRQAPLQHVTDEITKAAADYAALCEQANERLRKCSSFLQQGLRSEAIHLAEESPNLLDMVAALDLPDAQTWIDFCQNNGLAVPPPLQIERAAQLNDAYAADQPLEHLLIRHRWLALARGPVRERLQVLRQIAQADGANPSWEKDIRVFEKARLKELPTSYYDAVKNRDGERIAQIRAELTDSPWYEPVPEDLAQAVTDAHARMQRAKVEEELRGLIEPLRDAFAARSLKECQALVQRWKNIMTSAGVTSVSSELTDEIKPVQAFINETVKAEERQRKFRDSCKVFTQMLDRDMPEAELESAYAKLREFAMPIPDEIAERYAGRKVQKQKQIERKHRMNLFGIGATAAALVIVSLVIFWIMTRSNDAAKWAAKLHELVSQKKWAESKAFVAELEKNHPSYANEAVVANALREARTLGDEHDKSASALSALLTTAGNAEQTAGPISADKAATTDQLATAAAQLRDFFDAVRNAGDLAWVDTDHKLSASVERLQGVQKVVLSRITSAVRTELDVLSQKVAALPTTPDKSTETLGELAAAGARLRDIQNISGLDNETLQSAADLAKKIDAERASLSTARDQAGELENVRLQAVSVDDLKKALASFADRYPTDDRTADFKSAIKLLDSAGSVDKWRDVVAPWARLLAPTSAATAQKRGEAVAAFLTANPGSPLTSIANSYGEYLKRAAAALAEKSSWQESLEPILNEPVLTDLSYIEISDGRKYMVLGDINKKIRRLNEQVTTTFEAVNPAFLGDNKAPPRIEITIEPPAKLVNDKPTPTPHAKIMNQIADQVKLIDSSNWDTFGIDMADQIVNDKSVDPVAKGMMLQSILQVQSITTPDLQELYAQPITEIARQSLTREMLVNPKLVTDGMKKALAKTFDSIPPAVEAKKRLAAAKATLFGRVAFETTGTGVLLKGDDGNWIVSTRSVAADGNILWTITPVSTDGSATAPAATTLTQIGTVAGGKISLDAAALRGAPQGDIVFITRP